MQTIRPNLKSLLTGGCIAGLLALVGLSIHHAYAKQKEIRLSNELLASFEREIASIDTSIYPAYVGIYRLEPDFNIAITTDAGRLYAQGSNQIRVEIFPASKATFFNNYTEALITFEPPADAQTGRFILRQKNKIRHGVKIRPASA